MELSEKQLSTLRQLYLSKGDALEAAMVEGLTSRGIEEDRARAAARACSNRIWRNGTLSGATTAVLLGSIFTPVVGAVAGGSMAGFAAWQTLLHSESCAEVRDVDLRMAVEQLSIGG
jgi:hypothetical protein